MITHEVNLVNDYVESHDQKMIKEAKLRVQLEGLVEVNQRYSTIFLGLKLNTAHNSAVTHLLSFMVRRLVYAGAIVYMSHIPQISIILLMAMSVYMITFTVSEKQWKDPDM